MLPMDEIESGLLVTHRNTGLRYSVVDIGDDEVLLSPEQDDLQDLELLRRELRKLEGFDTTDLKDAKFLLDELA